MATDWADYTPDLLLEINGAPETVLVQAVRAAAIELCRETHVWSVFLDKESLIGGDGDVDIDIPTDSQLQAVLSVRFYPASGGDARILKGPFDAKALDALMPTWRTDENTGTLNYPVACLVRNESPAVLQVVPKPAVSQNDAIEIEVALRPTRDCTSGPDNLYNDYLETIVAGALSKLYVIPDKPWTSLEHAADRRSMFAAMKTDAKNRVLRGTGNAPLAVYPRTLA